MDGQERPIGYWLKKADELLTERIDDVQRANDITRLEWQIFNVVRDSEPICQTEIVDVLRRFADESIIVDTLDELVARELIAESEGTYELTDEGLALYDRALSAQQEIREIAMTDISKSEYSTTMRVLRQLVKNLQEE